jgi:hypothetical protein
MYRITTDSARKGKGDQGGSGVLQHEEVTGPVYGGDKKRGDKYLTVAWNIFVIILEMPVYCTNCRLPNGRAMNQSGGLFTATVFPFSPHC